MRTKFGVDTTQAQALAGYMEGMAETVSTKQYIDSAIKFTEQVLSEEFGIAMDTQAMRFPLKYRHVYEWGRSYEDVSTIGSPFHRLWALRSAGRGGRRVLNFIFLPSDVPTPIHPELLVPGETGKSVKPEVHIFVWKAPIIEYNLPVVIKPKLSKALAFYDDDEEEIVITSATIKARPGKANNAAGSFTTFFINWWTNGPATKKFQQRVRPELERDLSDISALRGVIAKQRRAKSLKIGVNDSASYKEGKAEAKKRFSRASSKYIAEAARRRFELYGD